MNVKKQSEIYLDNLEMELLKNFDLHFKSGEFLLCISGGMDSMALLHFFKRLSDKRAISIRSVYVHHGLDSENAFYRESCFQLVHEKCKELEIPFISNFPEELPEDLSSEESMRDFRYSYINKIKARDEFLVTAHHLQDLLETRFIRLIRGTSGAGIGAMDVFNGQVYRPFLELEYEALENYVKKHSIKFLEDPSNSDSKYLRNFLRKDLLPSLEAYRPGSKASLARSLDNLAQASNKLSWTDTYYDDTGVEQNRLLCLSDKQKEQVFANYLYHLGHFDFRKSQLSELIRRLDRNENDLRLKLMGVEWVISQGRIHIIK